MLTIVGLWCSYNKVFEKRFRIKFNFLCLSLSLNITREKNLVGNNFFIIQILFQPKIITKLIFVIQKYFPGA